MRMCWDFFKRSKSKDADKEKWKKKTKSDTKQRIKTARRWKRLVKDFNNAHNTHIHTQTSLSANSSYFSPNTVVLTEWAITMVIRKMWSEQQGFERWSWLHANTQKYMQLHFMFLLQSCTIIIVRTHSAHNLMLIDHTETTQYFCPRHIVTHISICMHTYCENSWASLLQEHTHIPTPARTHMPHAATHALPLTEISIS